MMNDAEIRCLHRALLVLKKKDRKLFNEALNLSRSGVSSYSDPLGTEAIKMFNRLRGIRSEKRWSNNRPIIPGTREHILGHRHIPRLSDQLVLIRLQRHVQSEYHIRASLENQSLGNPLGYIRYKGAMKTPKDGLTEAGCVAFSWKERLPRIIGFDMKQKPVQMEDAFPVGDGIFYGSWSLSGYRRDTGLCAVIKDRLRVFPNPDGDTTIHGKTLLSIERIRRRK